jgi:hypothetical protein
MWPFEGEIPEDDSSDSVERVPLSTLFRWYMYDNGMEHPNSHINVYNLNAVSEEGDEKERQDSQARLDELLPLISFLELYAEMNAEYIMDAEKSKLLEILKTDETKITAEIEALKESYRDITYAGLVAAMSSALELGLINLNGTYTKIR